MMDEISCIQRAQQGDVEAFASLMSAYEKKIFNIAVRMMGAREDAADIAQETMIKIFQSLPRFRAQCSFGVWVYRVTVNTCMDELRRRKRKPSLSLEAMDEAGVQFASSGGPEASLESAQLQEAIAGAILRLEPDYRLAVVLRDVQGLSYQEIAEATGATLGTVKSRISRARGMLQKTLKEQGYMPGHVH